MPTQVKVMGPKQGHRGYIMVQEVDTVRSARPGDRGFLGVATKAPAIIGPGEERDFWVKPDMQLLVTEHEGAPQVKQVGEEKANDTLAAIAQHRGQAPAKKIKPKRKA